MHPVYVYTRAGCARCESTKRQLKSMNVDYSEVTIGKDVTREEVMVRFPGVQSLPILSDNDHNVITLEDLK